MKAEERWRNCHRLEGTKETRWLQVTWDPGWDPGTQERSSVGKLGTVVQLTGSRQCYSLSTESALGLWKVTVLEEAGRRVCGSPPRCLATLL